MRGAGTGLGEDVDVAVAQVNGVGEPHVRAEPAELLHVVDRALPDLPQAVLLLVEGLGKVRVQAYPLGPGQRGGLGHQVGTDGERRAGGDRDAEPGGEGRVVVGVDGLGRGVEDLVEPFDHHVRRQATLRPTPVHRASGGVEAEPDLPGRLDLRGEQIPAPGREDVVMVAGGGAAGQGQIAQPRARRALHHLGVHRGPHLVERRQPLEQRGVLGEPLGGPLVEVVVGVDQAGVARQPVPSILAAPGTTGAGPAPRATIRSPSTWMCPEGISGPTTGAMCTFSIRMALNETPWA